MCICFTANPMIKKQITTMKNAATIAIFGLVLVILVNFYYVLIDFRTIQPIKHGAKIMEVLAFIGYIAILPFFVKFRQRKLIG
jgi:membrane protein YdbS with pleckstrin-like domain